MNATRRLSLAALAVACLHLVFGAIVRISGSGMGCGDHWPKCYGYWFPPFNRPDLIVEVSHRYLASILTLTVLSMAFVAWRNRRVPGVGGKGGAMRSAFGAVAAVFSAALLGGLTVKMGNAPWATVAHWLVAMTLLAMVATTAIRSGALGGASSLVQQGTQRARRSGFAAAGLAIFAVALGGLTAKYPGAAVGCTTVPMCGPNPAVETASVHVQITHRTLAVLLVLHLFGVVMMVRKRRAEEAPVVFKAAHIALGMVLLQLVVASSMVLFHLPPVLRSLHEATGVGIWLSCFTLAYLARRASKVTPPEPATLPDPSPKGGISITREPVAVATVIAATETLQASAPVAEAGVAAVEDIAVVQETPVAEETAVVEETAVFEQGAEPQSAVILSEVKDPLVAEETLEIATEEAGLPVASLPEDEGAVAEAIVVSEKLPPALEIVAEVEIVEPEPVVVLSESKDPFAEDIITVAATEAAPVAAERSYEDVTAEAAIVAELILAIEDAAKEAALESAVARAEEAAIVAEAIAAIGPLAEITAPEVEEAPAEEIIEIAAEEIGPSVAAVPHDDSIELALPQEVEIAEDLDWEPHRAQSEELDEFSIAALEAEVAALEAAQVEAVAAPVIEAVAIEPEPVVESTPVIVAEEPVVEAAPIVVAEDPVVEAAPVAAVPTEQLAADASVIVPPVKAPKVSPIPAPTMAVLVARGADFL